MKELKLFIVVISVLLILYFLNKPMTLRYYFNDPLGRTLSLLYILILTSYYPLYGLIFSILFIGIYNSKVKPFEGMENKKTEPKNDKPVDKKPIVPTATTSINTSSLKEEKEDKPSSVIPKPPSKKKEGYENIHTSLLPSFYGTERDKIIHLEKIIRPKPSNSFLIMQNPGNTSHTEPMSFYYGKSKEPFATMASV